MIRTFFIPLLILLVLLGICVSAFSISLIEYVTRRKGRKHRATILEVLHVIPLGLRRFLSKKDGKFSCDYILLLSYTAHNGSVVEVKKSAHSTMRMLRGNRIPRFAAGDKMTILVLDSHPKTVLFDEVSIAPNDGAIFPLILWTFCILLLLAISGYIISTGI